jgi:hypothetical protein
VLASVIGNASRDRARHGISCMIAFIIGDVSRDRDRHDYHVCLFASFMMLVWIESHTITLHLLSSL